MAVVIILTIQCNLQLYKCELSLNVNVTHIEDRLLSNFRSMVGILHVMLVCFEKFGSTSSFNWEFHNLPHMLTNFPNGFPFIDKTRGSVIQFQVTIDTPYTSQQ